jgi:hypothetical protein
MWPLFIEEKRRSLIFIRPSRDGPYYVIEYGGRVGVHTINLVLYIGSLPNLYLAEGFQRRRLKCEKLTDDGRQVMAKAHISLARRAKNLLVIPVSTNSI